MEEIWKKLRENPGVLFINLFDNILPPIVNGKLPEELTNDPRYDTIIYFGLNNLYNLTTIEKFPVNLKNLEIINCMNITSLKNFPSTLEFLEINRINNLSSIDVSNTQLERLKIHKCPGFRSFGNLPLTLKFFNCESNTYIDGLPNFAMFPNLQYIVLKDLVVNEIPSLPNVLINLLILNCNIAITKFINKLFKSNKY